MEALCILALGVSAASLGLSLCNLWLQVLTPRCADACDRTEAS